jgi:hypothetical protein
MSQAVRIGDDDYEKLATAQEILGLPFPDVVHLGLWTDLLKESPKQNATRAIENYYAFILHQYDDPQDVPVEELEFEGVDQAKTALTIGDEKRRNWEQEQYPDARVNDEYL